MNLLSFPICQRVQLPRDLLLMITSSRHCSRKIQSRFFIIRIVSAFSAMWNMEKTGLGNQSEEVTECCKIVRTHAIRGNPFFDFLQLLKPQSPGIFSRLLTQCQPGNQETAQVQFLSQWDCIKISICILRTLDSLASSPSTS